MKLTDGEKLILLMLSEIYEKLGVYGETDPKFVRSTILNDMLWGLTWKYSGIPFEKTENPAAVGDVVSILDMWRLIEQSYAKLPPADKKCIETDAAPFGKNVSFLGFDGNNESEYMAIARFLVEDIGTFEYFKGRILIRMYHRRSPATNVCTRFSNLCAEPSTIVTSAPAR